MLDKALWERIKIALILMVLVAFNLLGYYLGFLCTPYWSFNLIAGVVCFFTPVLLMALYSLATGESAMVAIFTKRNAAIATASYLLLWLSFGMLIEVYRILNSTVLTEQDFQPITLVLADTEVERYQGDKKLPEYYFSYQQYPDYRFYLSKGLLDEQSVKAIDDALMMGGYLSVDVTTEDFETKLTSIKQPGLLNCLYCFQIIEIHSLSYGNNVIIPLTKERIKEVSTLVWVIDVLNVIVFIAMPIFFMYRLRRNWKLNKQRGWIND